MTAALIPAIVRAWVIELWWVVGVSSTFTRTPRSRTRVAPDTDQPLCLARPFNQQLNNSNQASIDATDNTTTAIWRTDAWNIHTNVRAHPSRPRTAMVVRLLAAIWHRGGTARAYTEPIAAKIQISLVSSSYAEPPMRATTNPGNERDKRNGRIPMPATAAAALPICLSAYGPPDADTPQLRRTAEAKGDLVTTAPWRRTCQPVRRWKGGEKHVEIS